MSIRFLDNLNSTTERNYQGAKELFDPRYNKFYDQDTRINFGENYIKFKNFISALQSLFQKRNLTPENLKLLIGTHTYYDDELDYLLVQIIPSIDPDKLWILAFMDRENEKILPGTQTRIRFNKLTQSMRENNFIYFDEDYVQHTFSTAGGFSKERFLPFFNKVYDDNYKQFENFSTNEIFKFNSFGILRSQFVKTLMFYTADCKFPAKTLTGERNTLRPSKISNLLRSDPTFSYEVTNTNREVRINYVSRITKENRVALHQIYSYQTNVLNILPYPNKMKNEVHDPILVGVELELCTDYTIGELIDAADEPFFLGKADSSISGRGNTKVELVTAPSTFKYLKKQYALWFNNLDYSKFDCTTDTSNGMHVHVGRTHFEDNTHIRNFCWFFNNPANTEFLVQISERGSVDAMARYSPFYQFSSTNSRVHAFKEVTSFLTRNNFRGVTNFKGGWASATTVEVRMFKGIVSFASIVKNLEFTEAVFHFTRSLSSYQELNLKYFLEWLEKTPENKYIVLKKFISNLDLSKILSYAEVKDIIFNETDEDKIFTLIEHSKIKLTNEHIQVLNKGKKKTFFLNKETGKLDVVFHNRGKLSSLDKELAQRWLPR